MKKLNRDLLKEFYGYHSEKNIAEKNDALKYLDKIKKMLKNYEYESDDDFILLGRKKFIIDEIMEIINGNKVVDNSIYFILGSLEEFMCNNNHVSIADSLNWNNDWNDLRNSNDRYSAKKIVCLEEKKYIDEIIEEIEKYISNNKDR